MMLDAPKKWEQISFPPIADSRGLLNVIEGGVDIGFEIARVYYLHGVPENAVRGGHAHRELYQVYLALSGNFVVHLTDGYHKETVKLDRPDRGLLIRPGAWRTLDGFSDGALCFVLASARYSEADYIREYSEFERYASEQAHAA